MAADAGQDSQNQKSDWKATGRICLYIIQHLIILLVFLACLCLSSLGAWGVKWVITRATGEDEGLAEYIRTGGEVVVIVVIAIMVLIYSAKEIGRLWKDS